MNNQETRRIYGAYISNESTLTINPDNGAKRWTDHFGLLHRKDGPALIYLSGLSIWYKHGRFHREGGPAIEWPNGRKEWYTDGRLNRLDGPAVEDKSGNEFWINDTEYIDLTNYARDALRKLERPLDAKAVDDYLRSIFQKELNNVL